MKNNLNNVVIHKNAKRFINSYFRLKNISIYDILKNAGFDITEPCTLYMEKGLKGNLELILRYRNKKYNINLCTKNLIEIIEYSLIENGKTRFTDSYALYKISSYFNKPSIKTVHQEINTIGHYKRDNDKTVETSYEECDFYFTHQEVWWGKQKTWAIRIMPNDTFPYHIELKYHSSNKENTPNVKIDIVNQKLKDYFASINIETPMLEILKKVCELSSIKLEDINTGKLTFYISEKQGEKLKDKKYLSLENGICEIFENDEVTIYSKEDDTFIPKVKSLN